MKPGYLLCCRCLFSILGVNRAQNLAKNNKRLRVHATNQQKPRDYVIHA